MINRTFWIKRIEKAWRKRSVIWLSGVRRVGKTCLCKTLPAIEYFDCELPRIRRMMDDPETFLEDVEGKRVVLDEIHRLGNPGQLLKIAADYFPGTKMLATGSSTLGASRKFSDTLAGRKIELWLTPMISHDLKDFKRLDMRHRLKHGGLPPFFLDRTIPETEFQEWVDAFWAKDIQELFRLERRYSFQKFFELLMAQSGGIFEATRFSGPCEVSRTTISNYLAVLESTFVINVIRPFSTRRATEITSAPKVYGFDTGFVCYHRDWKTLRMEDCGLLWEHYVLNELHAQFQTRKICYWRDKRGHEIDFIFSQNKKKPIAIECRWSAKDLDTSGLRAFRRQYPRGENYLVSRDVEKGYRKKFGDFHVHVESLSGLIKKIARSVHD